jgi:predicted ATPase
MKSQDKQQVFASLIVKSFIEQGMVFEHAKGKWKFSGELKTIRVPDTVEGLILSRIDRLDIKDRDVLQTASVLGREFDEFILQGIYHDTVNLKRSLNNLKFLDLLGSERQRGEVHYIFKHVLTQEVAYDTLSFAKKRELHCKTDAFIESTLKTRQEEFLGFFRTIFTRGLIMRRLCSIQWRSGKKQKKYMRMKKQ